MRAQDVMTEDVTTVEETAPLGMAYTLLSQLDIRHLPVVRGGSEVVGMLSDRDMRTLGISPPPADVESIERVQALLDEPVSSVMSSDVIRVSPETDLRDVVDLMVENKIGAVPVVEAGSSKLIGIVSYVDVLNAARDAM